MSYILDALKKSDQQRQRGATPTLLTAQVTAAEPRQAENWIYGLIAAVLVGAGVVIGWLHPWQPEPQTSEGAVHEAVSVRSPGSGPRETAPARTTGVTGPALPEVTGNVTREMPLQRSAARPVPAAPGLVTAPEGPARSPSGARTREVQPDAVTAAPREAPTPVPEKPVAAGLTGPEQGQRVMTMGELPASIRGELPSMQISLHLYSTRPKNRFVDINGRMLQEGEELAPGIKLEQITPDGMIFSYKGYRFRRGVQ